MSNEDQASLKYVSGLLKQARWVIWYSRSGALNLARTAGEAVLQGVYVKELGAKARPEGDREFHVMFQVLRHRKALPKHVCDLLNTIQSRGNTGSHPYRRLERRYVSDTLSSAEQLRDWYAFDYLGSSKGRGRWKLRGFAIVVGLAILVAAGAFLLRPSPAAITKAPAPVQREATQELVVARVWGEDETSGRADIWIVRSDEAARLLRPGVRLRAGDEIIAKHACGLPRYSVINRSDLAAYATGGGQGSVSDFDSEAGAEFRDVGSDLE